MVGPIRTIGHEDRISLVDHLEELRTRLIIGGIALGIAFAVCLWQNHTLLHIINAPLKAQTRKQVAKGEGTVGQAVLAQQGVLKVSQDTQRALRALSRPGSGVTSSTRAQLQALAVALKLDVARIPRHPQGDNPATLGVGEPFTTTLGVSLAFALVASLPVILYQLYGFIVPALRPAERRAVRPPLMAVPVLFIAGVLFGYFVVLPAATRFFVNFNSSQFNIIVQAAPYYRFAATILLAMGLVFQVPVVIVGAVRAGLVTPAQLRKNRRYAILACAVLPPSCRGTSSPCCWRRFRCICCMRRVSLWQRSLGARTAERVRQSPPRPQKRVLEPAIRHRSRRIHRHPRPCSR